MSERRPGGVENAFTAALETTPRLPRDAAYVQLGLRYAETMDDLFDALATDPDAAEDRATHARVILEITRIGARFEACMDRLGMSPGSRPVIPNPGGERGQSPEASSLQSLRDGITAGFPAPGLDYAAAVDPAVAEADAEE